MRAYIDSDVLIWHLRGKRRAVSFLRDLRNSGEYELWTGALQRAEVVFFMRPGEEEATGLFLSQFKTAPADQAIVDTAGALYRKWHPSHGIDVSTRKAAHPRSRCRYGFCVLCPSAAAPKVVSAEAIAP